MLSAEQVILMWLSAQSGLPPGLSITPSQGESCFKVVWKHPSYDVPFTVFRLQVNACVVTIQKDNREKVRNALTAHPEGFAIEKRVFDALAEHTDHTPVWFIHAKRSKEFHDLRGIDGFVHARVGKNTADVPFQIKSSKGGIVRYFEKYPEYRGKIAVICIQDTMCNDTIRARVYSAIGGIRKQVVTGAFKLEDTMRLVATQRTRSHG
ncbi:MAG: hypothetical protein RLZZ234_719 [Candidatus Parcubacteria bacterium]|jgi:hypothetical protein